METPIERQELKQQTAENNLYDIFDLLSGVSLVGGVFGSFLGNAALSAFPLSFALALQIASRRKLAVEMAQNQQLAIQQITEQTNNNQAILLSQFQELTTQTNQDLTHQNQDLQQQLDSLSDQLQDTQQSLDDLLQDEKQLTQFTHTLESQQKEIEAIVGNLQKIENFSQLIRTKPSEIEAYYQRGLSYQKLGDKTGAIEDYTEVLHLDSTHAKAYHNRGLLLGELGNKKQAIEDFRLASKYYFKQGDIESYEQARNLVKEFYKIRHSSITNHESTEAKQPQENLPIVNLISVGSLFNNESENQEKATILG